MLVLTVANASRLSVSAWWHLSAAWFGLYTVCGLVMASVARSLEGAEEVPGAEPDEQVEPIEPIGPIEPDPPDPPMEQPGEGG